MTFSARRIGLALYWLLDESRLELEFSDSTTVAVDGLRLLQVAVGPFGLHDRHLNPFAHEERKVVDLNRVHGVLTISLRHPLWQKDAWMASALKAMQKLARDDMPAVHRNILMKDDTLSIRVAKTDLFSEGTWLDEPVSADEVSTGASGRRKTQRAFGVIETVCEAVFFLLLQIKFAAHGELAIAQVSGDRRTLTREDVSSSEAPPWVAKRGRDTALTRYAAWLGRLLSGENAEGETPSAPRDDFVNDVLGTNLFGSRRYSIKAEVARVERTGLLERVRDEVTQHEWLDASLFLEDGDGRRFDFADVGSGLSYLFPVMATLWEAKLSWVEQPELHLHPAAQCEIGDMFIRALNRGRFSIVETHSEHLLLRVLRRIRGTVAGKVEDTELRCPPEAVCVLYFEPTEDGCTKVHRLRVSRAGDFMDRWPGGFFEERDRELFDE